MKRAFSLLIFFVWLCLTASVYSDQKERDCTEYEKAIRGLRRKEIHSNLRFEKMFALCVPTWRWTVGPFTGYEFDCIPGYHGLTIVAKNGLLVRATEWSCTYVRVHFDEMTADDERYYRKLCKDNKHVPPERCIGRLGWRRLPMREWKR